MAQVDGRITTGAADAADPATAARRRRVLVTVLVGVAATSFPITLLGASLPRIADDLGTDEATISWVMIAPTLGFAVAIPLLGKLGDIIGHRRVYIGGFAAATALAGATALAWDAGSLVALRTLGQMTGAATGPASMAIIMSSFPKDQRAKAVGWWATVTGGSPALGLVFGGPLIDLLGWRAMFVVQAIPAAIAVVAAIAVLPETPRRTGVQLDLLGATTLGAGVGAALFALNRGVAWGWQSPAVAVSAVLAPLALVAFVVIEQRVAHPLLPLGLLRRPNVATPMAAELPLGAAYMGAFVLVPFLLTRGFGYSVAAVTWVMAARPLAWVSAAAVSGSITVAIGERRAALLGTGSMTVALAIMALGAGMGAIPLVILGLVVSGAGYGITKPPFAASIANAVDDADLGIASAAQNVSGQVGAAAGITILTAIGAGADGRAGFATALWVGTAIAAAAVVLSVRLEDFDRSAAAVPDEAPGPAPAAATAR